MIFNWVIYGTLISLLMALAAALAEGALRMRHAVSRVAWALAMAGSLLLPLAMATMSLQLPAGAGGAVRPQAVALHEVTTVRLAPIQWVPANTGREAAMFEKAFEVGWGLLSAAMLTFLALHIGYFNWRKRAWNRQLRADAVTYIAPDTGPAVFGFSRPQIVLPAWLTRLPLTQQELIVRHERSHLQARDPQLVFAAFLILCTLPWNVPLWWQFLRLRRAIEVDCDRRVLRAGADPRAYGEALIAVAQRRAGHLTVALSMAHAPSLLERRIAMMTLLNSRSPRIVVAGLLAASVSLVAMAAQVSPPGATAGRVQPAQLVKIDQALLDRYAGAYQYSDSSVMHVVRQDDHLLVNSTGHAAQELYPLSATEFFYTRPQVDARIEFIPTQEPVAMIAVLRQNGAETRMQRIDAATAAAIESRISARVADQVPNPRSEAVLRELVEGMLSGEVDYGRLNPQLAGALRKDLPKFQLFLSRLGQPQSYRLTGVAPGGFDEYEITHERGTSRWSLAVDGAGIVTGASVPL